VSEMTRTFQSNHALLKENSIFIEYKVSYIPNKGNYVNVFVINDITIWFIFFLCWCCRFQLHLDVNFSVIPQKKSPENLHPNEACSLWESFFYYYTLKPLLSRINPHHECT